MSWQQIPRCVGMITLMVHDLNDAIAFFKGKLGMKVYDESNEEDGSRFVTIHPCSSRYENIDKKAGSSTRILLKEASSQAQKDCVGKQCGDAVMGIIETLNFETDYNDWKSNDVIFCEEPRVEPYGTVVIFEDLYGNKWDLIEKVG